MSGIKDNNYRMRKFFIVFLALSITSIVNANYQESDQIKKVFSEETQRQRMLLQVQSDSVEPDVELGWFKEENPISCSLCKVGVSFSRFVLNFPFFPLIVESVAANNVCPSAVTNGTICAGVVKSMLKPVIDAISSSFLSPKYFCEVYFGVCTYTRIQRVIAEDQVAQLLSTKPAEILDNNYVNNLYEAIKSQTGRPIIRAVHMTDPHYDHKYKIGSDVNCNLEMCCRHENGYPTETNRQAKKWGGKNCDLPEDTIRSMLQFVKSTIKPKLFFWTGDNGAHDLWENTQHDIIHSTINVTNFIKEELAGEDISFYPIQGNHDVWPVNLQDFSYPNANPSINGYAPAWQNWLDAKAYKQFKKYGYYSTTLKLANGTAIGNTKVIGLNTQIHHKE